MIRLIFLFLAVTRLNVAQDLPMLRLLQYSYPEDGGPTELVFIRGGAALSEPSSLQFYTTNSSTADADLTHLSATIHFGPNESQVVIPFQLQDDGFVEGPETFQVIFHSGTGLHEPSGSFSLTIADNEIPLPYDLTFAAQLPLAPNIIASFSSPSGPIFHAAYNSGWTIVRLLANGSVDPTFNTPIAPPLTVSSLAVDPDGRLYAMLHDHTYSTGTVVRFKHDGSIDPAFNSSQTHPHHSLAVQADGKLLLGIWNDGPRVIRLLPTGEPDPTFQSLPFTIEDLQTILPLPDGKILLTARYFRQGFNDFGRWMRLNPDGSFDSTFTRVAWDLPELVKAIRGLDGRLYIYGNFKWSDRAGIMRLSPDGFPDNTPPIFGQIHSLAVQSDGTLWINGANLELRGLPLQSPVKLNPDWQVDRSFVPLPGLESGRLLAAGNDIYFAGNAPLAGGRAAGQLVRLRPRNTNVSAVEMVEAALLTPEKPLNVALRRYGPTTEPALVMLHGAPTSAAAGEDYSGLSTQITFAPLQSQFTFPLQITADTKMEFNEEFAVEIGRGNSLPGLQDRTTIFIADDDGRPGTAQPDCCLPGFAPTDPTVHGLLRLPDGLLVYGDRITTNFDSPNRLVKLRPTGEIDPSFTTVVSGVVKAAALQGDGIIIAGRFSSVNGRQLESIARLKMDGSLDSTFNAPLLSVHEINSVTVSSDQKVLLGGMFGELGAGRPFGFMRLQAHGPRDPAFRPEEFVRGFVRTHVARANGYSFTLPFLYVAGPFDTPVLAFRPDGSPDPSFNAKAAIQGNVTALALDAQERLYVAQQSDGSFPILLRLLDDGSIDQTFALPPATGAITAITFDQSGNLLVGGDFGISGLWSSRGFARISPQGVIDSAFNSGTGPNGRVNALAVTTTGDIFAGGWFRSVNHTPISIVARLIPDAPLRFRNWAIRDGNYLLDIIGKPASGVALEQSANFRDWSNREGVFMNDYENRFSVPVTGNLFFRLKELEPPILPPAFR